MKELNVVFLAVGVLLLLIGYVPWWTGHEDIVVGTAKNIMTVLAGWAFTVMGYLGLQLRARSSQHEQRGFPITSRQPGDDA